jgi:CRISPR-associated protein Cmr2
MIEYSILTKQELSSPLQQMKRAAAELDEAKKRKDKNSKKNAMKRLQEAARQCVAIDPKIAYLWLKATESTESNLENEIRSAWQPEEVNYIHELDGLNISPHLPNLVFFPPGSWAIQLSFILRKPYISRDDTDFYIIDNPVKKERVFKVPYTAPSQWKGALRSAMMQELISKLSGRQIDEGKFIDERLRLYRLFGNEKDGTSDFLNRALARHSVGERPEGGQTDQEWRRQQGDKTKEIGKDFESELVRRGYRQGDIDGFQGSLHFYPTYFNQIGLEVINPHDRKIGTGKNPIYFECVPRDTDGIFTMLYVPLFGPEVSEEDAKEDLETVARGVKAMMTRYGFGAKTSSGFGVVDEARVEAKIEPKEFQDLWKKAWSGDAKCAI